MEFKSYVSNEQLNINLAASVTQVLVCGSAGKNGMTADIMIVENYSDRALMSVTFIDYDCYFLIGYNNIGGGTFNFFPIKNILLN